MHVGFPEKSLEKYANFLVKRGLKVSIVEQTETPIQMQSRLEEDKRQRKKGEKTINREVTEIVTIGTYVNYNNNDQ